MTPTHYTILGVPPGASTDAIKKAYRNLARTNHPDKAKDAAEKARLEDQFAAITTAYNVLKDEESRAAYDASLPKSGSSLNAATEAASSAAAPSPSAPVGVGLDLDKGRRDIAMRAYAQGVKLFQLGDYAKAADFLRSAVQNYPAEAQFQDRLAVCLLRCKRNFSEAVSAAMKASELDPYKSEYRMHLAELYDAIGSKDKALEAYREVLKWDPTNSVAVARVGAAADAEKPMAKLMALYKRFTGRS